MNLYVSSLSSHGFLNLSCILFSFCNFNMTTFPFVTSIAHINWSESLNQVARVLIEKGVKSAEPVASLLPNHLHAIWITYGIKLNGACEVALNFNITADDIRWCADVAMFKWILGILEHEQDGWHAT